LRGTFATLPLRKSPSNGALCAGRMTDKAKNILFIVIWTALLVPITINILITGFVLFFHAQGVISYLLIIAVFCAFLSFFAGFLAYIMISPWLFKKHQVYNFVESYFGLNFIFSESELKKLYNSTKDVSVAKTMLLLKYSKIGLVIFLPLIIIFSIAN
jgi:hypothetical protein